MISKFTDLNVHFKSLGTGMTSKLSSRTNGAFCSKLVIPKSTLMEKPLMTGYVLFCRA
jgi:hypothetical protein